jgi:hypothetical protein
VLDIVQQKVFDFFKVFPNDGLQQTIDKIVGDARQAVVSAEVAKTEADAKAAAADFQRAWAALLPLLRDAGILKGDKLGASASADANPLPEPLLLKVK